MNVGDVVNMTSCRVVFKNEKLSGSLGYKAPKGEQFVFLLLGSEPIDGAKLNPVQALNALGWTADIIEAQSKALAEARGALKPDGVDRILRAWDAGREVGVSATRAAVEKMIGEWQADMSAMGLVSEYNQANVLLDRLAAITPTPENPNG